MFRMNSLSWMLGFIGCLGLLGFTTDQPWTLLNFGFFSGFSYYWWHKMLGPVDSPFAVFDERFIADRTRAASKAFMWGIMGIFFASVAASLFFSDPAVLYRAELLIIAFGIALTVNAWAFLTYRYDRQGA